MCNRKKLKLEYYNNCFQASQLEHKIKYLEKSEVDVKILKKKYKHFIKNNKMIIKIQKRFKGKRHNVSTGEINKITLFSNDNWITTT